MKNLNITQMVRDSALTETNKPIGGIAVPSTKLLAIMMNDMTYDEAKKKATALQELGQTSVYLRGGEMPWEHVTSVEPGGSHRLEISTSVWFKAKCPETGLEFRWSFDIEPLSANGKGSYEIDAAACRNVTSKLKGDALAAWREYLRECAEKVRSKGDEWRKIADKQLTDAALLADLSCG